MKCMVVSGQLELQLVVKNALRKVFPGKTTTTVEAQCVAEALQKFPSFPMDVIFLDREAESDIIHAIHEAYNNLRDVSHGRVIVICNYQPSLAMLHKLVDAGVNNILINPAPQDFEREIQITAAASQVAAASPTNHH